MAVELAERHADGRATDVELALSRAEAREACYERRTPQSHAVAWTTHRNVLAAAFNTAKHAEPGLQCRVLRDLFGPSIYRPLAPICVSWDNSKVRSIAERIYGDRTFGELTLLADALEAAGCDDSVILDHCRQSGPHVRGCWVVDLVLGISDGVSLWV